MIPKLYQKDGTTLIGNLTNCIECLVEEERNGIFEVTFQYPNTESIATSLVYDNIVICDANDTLKNQKFRIYDTRRMMNNTIEVYARHISFDLAYDYINSIDITNQSCEYALNTIFRSSQFSTGYVGHSDIVNAQNYKISNCNALEAIAGKQGSIIDTYGTGAEILRDNNDIYVLNRRGNDNGVSIEYAKNLTGFELQENTDDLITRIIPFATYTPEGGEQTRVQGTAVDSSYISNYSHPFIAELDFSDKFKDKEVPTTAKLATMAQRYFEENKCDLPKQNWKIEFIPLSKCVGYESIEDAISLCDTVTIRDTRYNIDTKAKVIKTVYDVLRERYDSMELGEPRTTLGDIVNTGSEKGEQGPPGPQGPKGEDGNIGDFPDSVPAKPVLTTTLLGFASIQLDWTYENRPYYWYEVYASKTKDFTPNLFDIVHKGQTSSFLFQAKPGETWYFRVCGVNSYDHRSGFSDQKEVITTKVDDLSNYFTTAAIGQAVVGSLTADYMEAGIIKGHWIDAKNLSVTDGNGKRTLDIDSSGNVNLDVNKLELNSIDIKKRQSGVVNLISNSSFIKKLEGWGSINTEISLSEAINNNTKYPVKIHFIWLSKEGDCIFIQCDNGKNVLIDGGELETADSTISYLYNLGIKQIDLIIATHQHSDHVGATPKIIENFGCKELLIREPDWDQMPDYETTWNTKEYNDALIAKATSVGATIRRPSEGEVINISDEITLKIFNTLTEDYTAYNFLSFSILMTHLDKKYFFGGDMSIQSESSVLNKIGKVDVLCVSHSGYDDSTSAELLAEIKPDYSIILNPSVSAFSEQFNKIRTEETRYRLQFAESKIYATEQNGTIILNSNNKGYSLSANEELLFCNVWWQNNDNWYWFKENGRIAKNESIIIFNNTLQQNILYNFDANGICTNP